MYKFYIHIYYINISTYNIEKEVYTYEHLGNDLGLTERFEEDGEQTADGDD